MKHPLALAVTGLLALSACSGGTAASPPLAGPSAAPVMTARVTAAPSKPAPSPSVARQVLIWKDCGGGFQCSTLRVPLDDTAPASGTIELALTRTRATSPTARIGSLLINPGGPGASAVAFLKANASEIPAVVRSRFDLVAFDPRGVGGSAPIRCETTAELDRYFHLDPAPTDAAGLAALEAGNRAFAAGCRKRSGRVLPHVATVEVARDMDRVRAAVGDDKLTYLGYSYGTALGAAYLEQFPTHVRAMVLDGALDPTLTWDRLLEGQSRGFDVALAAYLADCQRTACAFRQAVKGDLGAAYDALQAKVTATPLPGDGTRTVGVGEFSLGVGAGLYSRQFGWPAISAGLAAAVRGQGAVLLSLSDSYLERTDAGYANLNEANFAVNCIDRPWPRTDAPYLALAERVARSSPRFGRFIVLSGLGCAVWPVAAVNRPHAVTGAGAPPVVIVGTTRDPATPYVWAQGLARQLTKAVLLTHVGDGHTAYRASAAPCLTGRIDAYLLTATAPAAATC